MLKALDFDEVTVYGDLAHRILRNIARLESPMYRPPKIFKDALVNWPGDFAGRTLLALVLTARASGREPAYIGEILDNLEQMLETNGYLGEKLPEGQFDEQQLSGHNWLTRGLMEHYLWKKCEKSLKLAKRIIKELYLPLASAYEKYPINTRDSFFVGEAEGKLTGEYSDGWHLSSDIGCAFMCFDALGQAYSELGMAELYPLLSEMHNKFMCIDFQGLYMQTHATLSCTRGILSLYMGSKDERFLNDAVKIFQMYLDSAINEAYGNYNWFSRPKSWTEPCAIVDSAMIAAQLFGITKQTVYLEWLHKIYYNALVYAQRPSGGFGCDLEAGADTCFTGVYSEPMAEAFWCCTMRGGEGLSRMAQYTAFYDSDTLYIAFYQPAIINTCGVRARIKTAFPENGDISIDIALNGKPGLSHLAFYIPSYATDAEVCGPTQATKRDGWLVAPLVTGMYRLSFTIPLICLPTADRHINGRTLSHGYLILGAKTEEAISVDDKNLAHIGDCKYKSDGQLELEPLSTMLEIDNYVCDKRQIVFI